MPGSVEIVAPAVSATPRLAFSVKFAVVCRVAAPIDSWPAVATAGAIPRLVSAPMERIPPLTVVAPV